MPIGLHVLGALVDQARAALKIERAPVTHMIDDEARANVPRTDHEGVNGFLVTCAAFTEEELTRQMDLDHPYSSVQRERGALVAAMVLLAPIDDRSSQQFLPQQARELGAALIAAADLAEGS